MAVIGAGRSRFVDGVDEVDVGVLAQAVLHGGLALGLVAVGVLAADHLRGGDQVRRVRVGLGQAHALQEAVVALRADGDAGLQIEGGDDGLLAAHGGLGPLADQQAGVEVVGGEQRVHRVLRLGGGVEGDHQHALRRAPS